MYDAASFLFLSIVFAVAFPGCAYAYVDPSVVTYAIQACAGVAVAVSAALGVVLRRTRRVLMKAFGIDENAYKVVEPSVHRTDCCSELACGGGGFDCKGVSFGAERRADYEERFLGWPKRFCVALLSSIFLVATVFVVAPFELVSSNSKDLVFGLSDIAIPVLLFAGGLALALALLLSFVRGRAFDVASSLVVSLGVCAYVQAMFLNSSLPSADGVAVVWSDYTAITLASAVVWLLLIAFFVVLSVNKASIGRAAGLLACVILLFVQGVGIGGLWIDESVADADQSMANDSVVVTEEGLFTVSDKDNVIVFVLDMFDTAQMNHLIETNSSILDDLDGFTFFRDSAGSMIPTRYGIPYLVTGELPQEGETFENYLASRYSRSSFLDDICECGYSVGVYSNSVYAYDGTYLSGTSDLDGNTINIHPIDTEVSLDALGTIKILSKCALYRDLPWIAKPLFWFYTNDLNYEMRDLSTDAARGAVSYIADDAYYYEQLTTEKISATDAGRSGAFRLIHLEGAHGPYTLQADGTRAPNNGSTDIDQQSTGALFIVKEYLAQMKELGLYEEATIIITADHGQWEATMGDITEPSSPIMLVKPKGASAGACLISDTRTGHVDYPATVIEAVGGDSSKYGLTVFDEHDENRVRYYYTTTHDGKIDGDIKEYEITGRALDFDSWYLTGREWHYGR